MPFPFLGNATKNDVPKNGKAHISKSTKAQAFKTDKSQVRKNVLLLRKKVFKVVSTYDYCVTYEWMWCDASLSTYSICSQYSLEQAYNWMADAYDTNVFFLAHCHDPE